MSNSLVKFTAKVKSYGNHYFPEQVVSGSLVKQVNGRWFLFDDEENYVKGLGDLTRYEWVEVEESTMKTINQKGE